MVIPIGNESWQRAGGLVFFLLSCVAVAPVHAEDLAQVYAVSKDSDPKYRAARFDFEAAAYAEPQALAALLPNLSFEVANTSTDQRILSSNNPVFASGQSKYPTDSQTLNLTQPIFKLSAWRGYAQAKAKVKQAAATFSAAEQDLMLRAATAYLNVLAARDALGLAQAERDAIKRQLDLVQQQFRSGLVAIANLHDAKARHALKDADVVAAQNDLDDKLQALRELTGKVFVRLKPLRESFPLEQPEPPDMNHWVEAALRQNVLLEARRQAVEVALQEMGRQQAAHLPVLDLVATQNRKDTGGSLFGGGSNVTTVDFMLRLNVPIYSGGLTSALTGEALKRYYSSLEDLERDARQVERQTRAAFQGLTGGVVRAQALAQGVTSSESARELKAEGYKAGLATLLQVLDAERDLYAAKRDSAKARYDFLLNRLRLKQAAGTLSDADLIGINRFLQ
ncbi:MAG: TolC family outer membrane protein [Pseudomonadota bacterium]